MSVDGLTRRARPEFDHRIDPFRASGTHPRCVDVLDRQNLATTLTDHLLAERVSVVGLYGSWGAGKSFVLDLTIDHLFARGADENSAVRPLVCHFQPWQYERDESLVPGLIRALETLPKQFVGRNLPFEDSTRKKLAEIGNRLRKCVRVALGMAKELPVGVAAKVAIAGAGALLGEQDPGRERADDTRESATEKIREVMQELVNELRLAAARAEGSGGDHSENSFRVVVVIDDLDRCAPDRMVDMLNWLKVHLSVQGCSYLLALDHGAAARAIVGQYKDYLGDSSDVAYGYRYLEKIVDHEVELSASTSVERMAAQVVDGQPSVNAIIAGVLGTQGARLKEIGKLVGMSTLQSPRTMLKLVHRFTSALEQVRDQEKKKTDDRGAGEQEQLPADYPFWLLLLTAMYYRLPPKVIDEFCHDLGDLLRNERPGVTALN